MPRRRRPATEAGMPVVLNGAPWYVKLVVWLLIWFGFPVAMCVIFLMVFVGYIPSPITDTSASMREHRQEMRDVLEYVKTSTRVQRQVCRNTSSNAAERVECDR